MEMTDHPRLADAPQSFRIACARLMLVWFWASWEGAADEKRDDAAKDEPRDQCRGYGEGSVGAHAMAFAAADDCK